jgi:GYF domain 2
MSWWYVSNGERRGPVNEDELARLLSNGALAPNSLLWKSGMKGWEPAANIADLKSLLSSLPPEVPRDQPSRLQRLKRHLGSTLALIIGGLALVAGLARVVATLGATSFEPGSSMPQAGVVIILGALAYRSAKKRRTGEAKSTFTRQFLEIASLVLICLVILMQNNLKYLIATDPVPNAVIPIWAILAYLAIVVMPKRWLLRSS